MKNNQMYYTLFTGKDNNKYFNLKAANHEIVLRGTERYKSTSDCLTGIRSVQNHGDDMENYEIKIAKNGEYYFVLKAKNHEPIAFGETYSSKSAMEEGLRDAMRLSQSKIIKGTDESRYELTVGNKTFDVKEGLITREQILELAGLRGRWCLFILDENQKRTEIKRGESINVHSCLKFTVVRLD